MTYDRDGEPRTIAEMLEQADDVEPALTRLIA
jgi:hypothetical protein